MSLTWSSPPREQERAVEEAAEVKRKQAAALQRQRAKEAERKDKAHKRIMRRKEEERKVAIAKQRAETERLFAEYAATR